MPEPRPLIGAQIKTAGGFALVPQRALDIGAEVVQIFDSNARIWKPRPFDPLETEALRQTLAERQIPLFFHTIYLINLATPDEELRLKSADALAEALFTGAVTGAAGVVTHVGSHRGAGFSAALPWVAQTVSLAREGARKLLLHRGCDAPLPELLLETSAGSGDSMGKDLTELKAMLSECAPACGLCLDTAHMFAAGLPVHTRDGLESLVSRLGEGGLLSRLRLMHLNDSKTDLGSKRDQHANLGEGMLGETALRRIVRHPALREIPFVLEVPGLDGHGPDATNIFRAKSMRLRSRGQEPPDRPS